MNHSFNIKSSFEPYGSSNKYKLGEGLFYDDQFDVIWCVDIKGQKIIQFKHNQYLIEYHFPYPSPSCVIPINQDELLIAAGQTIYQWNYITDQIIEICHLETADPKVRFNDAKCDARGRLWIGTLDQLDRPNKAGLYKMEKTTLTKKLDAHLSNGIGWNTNQTQFYYIDTPLRTLQVFEYDLKNGELGYPIKQIDLTPYNGVPDGLTVDTEDHIWIAMWNGYQIIRLDPEKKLFQTFNIPTKQPTTTVIHPSGYIYATTADDHIYRMYKKLIKNQPCYKFQYLE